MLHRLTVTALGAAAAVTLIASGANNGQLALAGMSSPLFTPTTSAAPPPAPKKCPANFASAMIGGQSKCLAPGQQCQQQNAKDYTRYGFTCNKVGNRYQLTKSTTSKPSTGKPSTTKPAPPKPPHH